MVYVCLCHLYNNFSILDKNNSNSLNIIQIYILLYQLCYYESKNPENSTGIFPYVTCEVFGYFYQTITYYLLLHTIEPD